MIFDEVDGEGGGEEERPGEKKLEWVGEDGREGSGEVRGDREKKSWLVGEDGREGSGEVRGESEKISLAWRATLSLSSCG